MSDRHTGPRRKVQQVRRVGSYGSVWWLHDLECGHIERRKRASTKAMIGCASCKSDERLLINVLRSPEFDSGYDAQVQIDADRLRAKLAAALGVPLEAVGIQVTMEGRVPQISGAMVFLHPEAANSVVRRFDSVVGTNYGDAPSGTALEVSYYLGEGQ